MGRSEKMHQAYAPISQTDGVLNGNIAIPSRELPRAQAHTGHLHAVQQCVRSRWDSAISAFRQVSAGPEVGRQAGQLRGGVAGLAVGEVFWRTVAEAGHRAPGGLFGGIHQSKPARQSAHDRIAGISLAQGAQHELNAFLIEDGLLCELCLVISAGCSESGMQNHFVQTETVEDSLTQA